MSEISSTSHRLFWELRNTCDRNRVSGQDFASQPEIFLQKPGFSGLIAGLETGFLAKTLQSTDIFPQKPGFSGLIADRENIPHTNGIWEYNYFPPTSPTPYYLI
jgi:hypothetical protein